MIFNKHKLREGNSMKNTKIPRNSQTMWVESAVMKRLKLDNVVLYGKFDKVYRCFKVDFFHDIVLM